MNKTDLVGIIAETADISKIAANKVLSAVLDGITNALTAGETVSIIGFGSFMVSQRKTRTGRNPQTGDAITIKAAKLPRFKAGKNLKQQVNAE